MGMGIGKVLKHGRSEWETCVFMDGIHGWFMVMVMERLHYHAGK